jgi:hypothetical protein
MRHVLNVGLAFLCVLVCYYATATYLRSVGDSHSVIPVALSSNQKIHLDVEQKVDGNGAADVDFGDCLFDESYGVSETITVDLLLTSNIDANAIYDLHSNSCMCVNVPQSIYFDDAGAARMQIVLAPRTAGIFAQNLSFVSNGRYITVKLNGRIFPSLRLVEWNGHEYREIHQHPYPLSIERGGATKLAVLQTTPSDNAFDFTLTSDDDMLQIEVGEAISVASRSNLVGRLFPISIRTLSSPTTRISSSSVFVSGRNESERGSISVDLDFGFVVSCYPRSVYLSNKNQSLKEVRLRIASHAKPIAASTLGADGVLGELFDDGQILLRLEADHPIGDQAGSATIKFDDESSLVLRVFTSVE